MTCFWSHKWDKWSEPEFKDIVRKYVYYREDEHVRVKTQERICDKCGLYQWREVD